MDGDSLIQDTPRKKTGSPQAGGPVFIAIGKIHKPHGFQGEMKVEIFSEFRDMVVIGMQVLVGKDHIPATVASLRPQNLQFLISFGNFTGDISSLEFRNAIIYLYPDQLPELDGRSSHYPFQVIGMQVVDENGVAIGIVSEVLRTGANDVISVKSPEKKNEILLPVIDEVIISINNEEKLIIARLQEWE